MRLIDADGLIKKAYRSEMWNRSTQAFDLFVVDAEDVEDAPTIDAVEVVRCRECLNAMKTDPAERAKWGFREDALQCGMIGHIVLPDDFCNYGVKMDAEVQDED